jgi:hypothetical protein
VLQAALLLSAGVTACGGTGGSTAASSSKASTSGSSGVPSTRTAAMTSTARGDYDSDDGRLADNDAVTLRGYGHDAPPSDRSTIVALVRRYFAAAAAEDGAGGCALIESSLARAVPLDYGRLGPPYMRGKTCAAVLTLLFRHEHAGLALKARQLRVTGVRLEDREGFALLSFGRMPERQISVVRDGGTWRVSTLLDGQMRLAP